MPRTIGITAVVVGLALVALVPARAFPAVDKSGERVRTGELCREPRACGPAGEQCGSFWLAGDRRVGAAPAMTLENARVDDPESPDDNMAVTGQSGVDERSESAELQRLQTYQRVRRTLVNIRVDGEDSGDDSENDGIDCGPPLFVDGLACEQAQELGRAWEAGLLRLALCEPPWTMSARATARLRAYILRSVRPLAPVGDQPSELDSEGHHASGVPVSARDLKDVHATVPARLTVPPLSAVLANHVGRLGSLRPEHARRVERPPR